MKLLKRISSFILALLCQTLTAGAQTGYCVPAGSCNYSAQITLVAFGTINNPSGCGVNGYANYTGLTAPQILAGTQLPIRLTLANYYRDASDVAIWIDYDRNGSFDATEYTHVSSGIFGGTVNTIINIRATAVGGLTRMRIRRWVAGTFTATDACLSYTTGETEDYNLYIQKIAITHQAFADTLYNSLIPLSATIIQTDNGIVNTDSLKPRLWARKYGTSNWVRIKGSLRSGTVTNGQWDFILPSDSLSLRKNGCDSVQYYFVAQDVNLPSYIGYLPSGANHSNVQVQVTPPPTLFGFRTRPALKDTIFMGSSAVPNCQCSSFTNDKGLFQDINNRGAAGPLTVIVEGDLLETGSYSLSGGKTNGYSLSVRTNGPTLHTIDASGYNIASFKLDSVQNFTIDGSDSGVGKYLRFRNKTATNNRDIICNIRLNGSCQNITIRNAIFEHQSYFEYNNSAAIYIAGSNNQQLTIADNLFQETTPSISWPKQHIMSVDSSSTAIIKRNEFSNFLAAGVYLVYGQNWIIDSNHFYRTKNPVGVTTYFTPILAGGGGHVITNNYIGGKSPYMAGGLLPLFDNGPFTIAGIMLAAPAGARPILVEKNYINNISATSTVKSIPSMFAGIFANANPAIIRGNIIGSTDTSVYGIQVLAASLTGISVWGNRPANITDNTIGGLTSNSQPGVGNDIKMAGIYTSLADTVTDTIIGNKIFHLKNMSNAPSIFEGGTVGINVIGGLKNIIERNTISDLYVTQSTVSGISINRILVTGLSSIRRNRIFDLCNTNTAIRSCCDFDDYGKSSINGIVMREINSDLEVGNNQISLTNRQIANPVTVRGIYSAGTVLLSSRHNIIYNSIYISGNAQENNASAAISTYGEPVTRIYNNLFVNQRKGGSLGHFIYRIQYFPPTDALAATKLNNNFYVLSDTTHFSQWGYIPFTSWQQWKLNTAADDSSSTKASSEVPVSQLFVNKNVGNLSINTGDVTCWAINDKGIPFSYEPDDYDSTGVRAISLPAYTDIGSDEFVPLVSSPGIACGCTCQSFTASVRGQLLISGR